MTTLKVHKDWKIKTIRSFDETPIRYGIYRRTMNLQKALVFLNGRSEWIEKYQFLIDKFNLPENVAFITIDHRGQGGSGGTRADIDSYDTFVQDVLAVIERACPNIPYSIIGHSMGGLISLYGTLREQLAPTNLVLTSPLLGFAQKALNTKSIKSLIKLASKSKIGSMPYNFGGVEEVCAFKDNPYTNDPNRFQEIINAPYRIPAPTYRWIASTLDAIQFVQCCENIENLACPILIISASQEKVVSKTSIDNWTKVAGGHTTQKLVTRTVEGAKHEILNETDTLLEPTVELIQSWLTDIW